MNRDTSKANHIVSSGELLSDLQDILKLPGYAQRLNINLEYGGLMTIEYRAVFDEIPIEVAERFREEIKEAKGAGRNDE